MADGGVTLDMSIDEEGLRKAIERSNKTLDRFAKQGTESLNKIDESIKKTTKEAAKFKIEPSTKGIEEAIKRLDRLNATIENQKATLANYKNEYARVAERFGTTSKQALDLERKILSLEGAIDKNISSSNGLANAIQGIESAASGGAPKIDKLNKKTEETKPAAEGASKGISSFEIALGNLISKGIEKAVSALSGLAEQTREYRKDLSMLKQNADDAGVGLGVIDDAMRNLNAITGETDSNVEAVSNLLAAGFSDNNLAAAVDTLSGAVIKFPDTVKIETLADSLQETLATKEATGQFAEVLGRLGYSVSDYNKRISTMSEAQARNYSITLLQRSGLAKVNEEYRKNNKDLVNSANAQYDYNNALVALAEVMEPLQTTILHEFTKLLVENKDAIASIIGFVSKFVEGLIKVIDFLMQVPVPVYIIIGLIFAVTFAILKFSGVFAAAGATTATVLATAIQTLAMVSPQAMKAGASFMALAADILIVAAALSIVLLSFAAVVAAFKGAPVLNFGTVNMPTVDDLKNQNRSGSGASTRSAYSTNAEPQANGLNDNGFKGRAAPLAFSSAPSWAEDQGPQLMQFNSSGKILGSTQNMAAKSIAGTAEKNTYITNYNSFSIRNESEWLAIKKRMENERSSIRRGTVKA